jgi:hypothetical protein
MNIADEQWALRLAYRVAHLLEVLMTLPLSR